jgi:Na+/proline symporter
MIAASFGVVSLCLAFVVGRLGTVLQGSIALSGAIRGPLFALFCLGIFFPFVNKKGALTGITLGIMCSLFIAVGTIVNERPKAQLPIMTHNCTEEIYHVYGRRDPVKNILPWDYEPEGVNKILHLSYFIVSFIGFFITIVTGVIVSLLTGSNHGEMIDKKLLSKYHISWGSETFSSEAVPNGKPKTALNGTIQKNGLPYGTNNNPDGNMNGVNSTCI